MKVGDKVRVVELDDSDLMHENLEVGCIGTITNIFCGDVFAVKFPDGVIDQRFDGNTNPDGTYDMYEKQLELIESEVEE